MSVIELVNDRFVIGVLFPDGSVELDNRKVSVWDVDPEAHWTIICPRCSEPSWAVTRHCVERHGDSDVEVRPPHPAAKRPDWFQPDWI